MAYACRNKECAGTAHPIVARKQHEEHQCAESDGAHQRIEGLQHTHVLRCAGQRGPQKRYSPVPLGGPVGHSLGGGASQGGRKGALGLQKGPIAAEGARKRPQRTL